MSNVRCLTTKRNEQTAPAPVPEEDEFMSDFYDWAMKCKIDTSTTEFKYNAATVLTVVKSLLHSRG